MKPSVAFIFMFTVEKSYYYSWKWIKKKGGKMPAASGAYPARPCCQYRSILSMALEMQCRSMRWEWAGLHQKILIKGWKLNHFYSRLHTSGSKNNCRRRLNWGDLTWTWSLTLNGSHPSDNDVSCKICLLLFLKPHSARHFYPAALPVYITEAALVLVAGGIIAQRSSLFLLKKHREDIMIAERQVSHVVLHWSFSNSTQMLTLTHCPCSHLQVQRDNK